MGIPLCVICCFSLAAFNICSLCLIFVNLINVSWGVSPWVYPVSDSLSFLDLGDYFLLHFREVFNYYLLKPGIKPVSPASQADSLLSEPPGKPRLDN